MSGPYSGAPRPGQSWQQPNGQGAPPPKQGMPKAMLAVLIIAIVVIVGAVTTVSVLAGTGAFSAKPKPQPTVEPTVAATVTDPDPTAEPGGGTYTAEFSLRDNMDLGRFAEITVSDDSDWDKRGGEYETSDGCWLEVSYANIGVAGEDDKELTAFLWERIVTGSSLDSIAEQDSIWISDDEGNRIEMRAFIVKSKGDAMFFAIRADSESGLAFQVMAGGCSELESLGEEIPQNVVFAS